MRKLWDFLDSRGANAISAWGRKQTVRDQARLDQRFDRLAQVDFDLAIATKLLAGPIGKQRHIYKMPIQGEVQLRPMLCKGPHQMEEEYTVLTGAIEKDWKLSPTPDDAEAKRKVVETDASRRCAHERIKKG